MRMTASHGSAGGPIVFAGCGGLPFLWTDSVHRTAGARLICTFSGADHRGLRSSVNWEPSTTRIFLCRGIVPLGRVTCRPYSNSQELIMESEALSHAVAEILTEGDVVRCAVCRVYNAHFIGCNDMRFTQMWDVHHNNADNSMCLWQAIQGRNVAIYSFKTLVTEVRLPPRREHSVACNLGVAMAVLKHSFVWETSNHGQNASRAIVRCSLWNPSYH